MTATETLAPAVVKKHQIIDRSFNLENVKAVLPAKVYVKSNWKAFSKLLISLLACLASIVVLNVLPWYLLPLGWIFAGTSLTGVYAIAHDCVHNSFFASPSLNRLIGIVCFVPIFYPVDAWKLHHNQHHSKSVQKKRTLQPQKSKSLFRLVNPIFWPYDIVALILMYYDLSEFPRDAQKTAGLTVFWTYVSIALFFPIILVNFGLWTLVKFWFIPWLGFHFWKNALRLALPAVSFAYPPTAEENGKMENEYKIQQLDPSNKKEENNASLLTEMSHYSFPKWFQFLCHDVNFQIPHYLSTDIPTYNLREAHEALWNSKWQHKINLYHFGWSLMFLERYVKDSTKDVMKAKDERQINWLHLPLFIFTHSFTIIGLTMVTPHYYTTIWTIIFYFWTGLGITAGYHRYWAHRAYDASRIVQYMLMLGGSGAFQGSILWWSRGHRIHHRYTDTDKDPYNAKRGFWYSHMGWMIFKEDLSKLGRASTDDLKADPMLRAQHRFFVPIATFMAFIFPTLVAGYGWGDFVGGFFYAGVIRLLVVHHATFFVNSLAHYLGDATFADRHTPRDSFITALLTCGEGYHNFHHEFPKDYRNAIRFYQYDPTKWLIRSLAFFGLTFNLKVFPENEIKKGVVQMLQKNVDSKKEILDWGSEIRSLPEMTWEQIKGQKEKTGDILVVIGNVVHNVSAWTEHHPGGRSLIESYAGKDATSAFNGGVYNHSNAGRNMLTALRIAKVQEEESHHPEAIDESKYEIRFGLDEKKKSS